MPWQPVPSEGGYLQPKPGGGKTGINGIQNTREIFASKTNDMLNKDKISGQQTCILYFQTSHNKSNRSLNNKPSATSVGLIHSSI